MSTDLEKFKRLVEQEAPPANALPSLAMNRVTEELDPEFLKQNSLLSTPAPLTQEEEEEKADNTEPENVTLEKSSLRTEHDSDFGRALEAIGQHSDGTGTLFHTEDPEVASPIVGKKEELLSRPVVTSIIAPVAINTAPRVLPSLPQDRTPLESRKPARRKPSRRRLQSHKRQAKSTSGPRVTLYSSIWFLAWPRFLALSPVSGWLPPGLQQY
ncbi:MAG: hypothetical protein WKF30_04815 [Pyrinomonadaceae bacterium]